VWREPWAECTVATSWTEVTAANGIRSLTEILSRGHPRKTADVLQLAAALRWGEGDSRNKGFVRLDNQPRRAAEYGGFDVLPEALEPG
jgi:hypothetical protein